jgi:K+-sensing histidine kinase KdpD
MLAPYTTRSSWARFAVALVVTLLVGIVRWMLVPVIGLEQPLLLFIFAVIAAAWWGGFGPGILSNRSVAAH